METIIKKINFLIKNKLGNSMRLEELLERINSGKKLYNSDIKYVERLYPNDNNSEIEEDKTKSETPESLSIKNSEPKKKLTLRNLPDKYSTYAISYNISYRDEVKIHANTCHHVQRASQTGSVKWTYAKNLKSAISMARKMYPKYGNWKYPRCCLYNGDSYFECKNCDRYSEGYDNTEKLHSKKWRLSGIFLIIFPLLFTLTNIQPRLTGLNILLMIIGIIVIAVENSQAPKVCSNCQSKDWGYWR